MKIYGKIYQIEDDSGEVFMNLSSEYGVVEAWTSVYKKKTILAQSGIEVHFIQFENEAFYQEWLDKSGKHYSIITEIKEEKYAQKDS